MAKRLLKLYMIFLLSSCAHKKGINLDWYHGQENKIVSREGIELKTDNPKFYKFGCLPFDEIIKLAKALNSCEERH